MSSIKFNRKDDESEDFMSAALYVDPNEKDENEDKPPQDGMAYLRQVIKERKTVPDTVVADYIPKKTSKSKPQSKEGDTKNTNSENQSYLSSRNKPPPPPGCCPGVDWQREQVKNFSDVRLKLANHVKLAKVNGEHELHQIPDKKNEALWCHLMLGGNIWNTVSKDRDTDSEEERIPKGKKEVKGEEPKLGFIAALPVHVCENVLDYMVSWLEVTGWLSAYGPWIYSILAKLEKPLTPEVGSSLRDLALFCAHERVKIAEKVECVEAGGVPDEDIAALNLFICLVSKYFDQGDLVDKQED